MVFRSVMRSAALIMFVAYLIDIASVTASVAQTSQMGYPPPNGDFVSLSKEAVRLGQAGRYVEATEAAQRALDLAERQSRPEYPYIAIATGNLAHLYKSQGRYAEAETLYKRHLMICEKALGPDHAEVALTLNNLGHLYFFGQGRYVEAEPLLKRALAIWEKTLGPDRPEVATALDNLAQVYAHKAQYAAAEELYKRSLTIRQKALGVDHRDVNQSLNNLAALYERQGRYAEAEPLYKRSLANFEKTLGPDHPDVGAVLNNLAQLQYNLGRFTDAEVLFKRSIGIVEKRFGPEHPNVAKGLNNLATVYLDWGRYVDAEPLYKRSLAIYEKALGPNNPDVAQVMSNLAGLYEMEGRYDEAAPLSLRAAVIREHGLGPEHPDVAASLNIVAELLAKLGRYAEAERLYKRVGSIKEKAFGPDSLEVANALNGLAFVYKEQGRITEAEPLYQRSLAIREKALGSDHRDVAQSLNNIAAAYAAQGRYRDAEPLYERSLAIWEKALGQDHPNVNLVLDNLGTLYFAHGEWARSTELERRSTALLVRRTQRGTDDVGQALIGRRGDDALRARNQFLTLVKAAYRVTSDGSSPDARLANEMFLAAQWAFASDTAKSLSQMAVRGANGDPTLAAMVRERQDLVAEWQRRDRIRSTAIAQVPDKRNRDAEQQNIARLSEIDARITIIDKDLAAKFPSYAALANPLPLSIEAVQSQLGPNEAVVLFLDTREMKPAPEETFVWVVTRTDMRWVRAELGTPALSREVGALRCGLDYTEWWTGSRCPDLLHLTYTRADQGLGKPLPFDVARAHKLYEQLFGQIEVLIKGKHLLIVPSGPLTQLPFQALVTSAPSVALTSASADYRDVSWLARRHAITVLPAVSSLKALREVSTQSHASESYVGFGNPLLEGEPERFKEDALAAKLAREKRCEPTVRQRVASLVGFRGGIHATTRDDGGVSDIANIRRWPPLPETADELCDVAHDLGVDPSTHLYLGAMATESKIKHLSEDGALANYKIVHFATHGAVAGQLSRGSEPGLVLTPPEEASAVDDGYLTASEIAALKLDADWVILSACNTAAGGAQGAEALSGLARAFFYAGARSLLVSHWEVASDSTVRLVTRALAELQGNPKIGRAEALRRSMLSMIMNGRKYEAHPAFWAPFVLVGEGGPAR